MPLPNRTVFAGLTIIGAVPGVSRAAMRFVRARPKDWAERFLAHL